MEEAGKQVSCVEFGPRASLSMLWVRESFSASKLRIVSICCASDLLKTSHSAHWCVAAYNHCLCFPVPPKPEYMGEGKRNKKPKMNERHDKERRGKLIRSH